MLQYDILPPTQDPPYLGKVGQCHHSPSALCDTAGCQSSWLQLQPHICLTSPASAGIRVNESRPYYDPDFPVLKPPANAPNVFLVILDDLGQ